MSHNPSSIPTADDAASLPHSATFGEIAKRVFLAWERLRVLYIVVLGLFTLLLAARQLGEILMIVTVIVGAIIANVCFFAGPLIETCVRWLGYDKKWVRWLLFVAGTMLTAMLALITVAYVPNYD